MRTPPTSVFVRAILIVLSGLFLRATTAGEFTDRVTTIHVPGVTKVVKAQRGADGTIHLLFDAEDGARYASSRDGGATFSQPISVVDAAARKPGLKFSGADLAVGEDGRVHVVLANNAWQLKLPQEEWSLYYARLAPGTKTFSPVRNLNRKPSEGFSIAANGRGAVTAAFLSDKLYVMTSLDKGRTFSASAELDPAWNPCNCCTTSVAYGSDGRLALLYREETNNERDMYVILWDQRHDRKPGRNRVSGTSWEIAACPMTYFTINPTDAGYVAAWPTKGRVYFARLDRDGQVLPPGDIETPGTTGMREGLVALGAADGATLMAWKHQEALGWQLYDRDGRPQGATGSAPSPGNGAAGVVLPDGRFALFP
ncbi:MAG: glycoside hydrolase [Acidobacteria bacterium]|nr:glycoside hydrolase [Acidobacteriota bacterium]